MKVLGTNSFGALMKMVVIALICPSTLAMAQRGVMMAQSKPSPRPEYHRNQPVKPAQSGSATQPHTTGAQPTKTFGNGARPPADQLRSTVPPGHLADWLNQHQNMPPAQQEQLLLRDPYFLRLNPIDQRKVIDQLHQMHSMNNDQLQRRLARGELIERLTPAEKMQVNASAERMRMLPPDRQRMMSKAFQDLRGVPMADRDMVLSSAYYRTTFSPAERIMLHDVLRVEPYEPVIPR